MKKCLLTALFLGISVAHAQLLSPLASDLQLTASADNPAPGQSVTVTANSYSTNIGGARFTWSVNGTVTSQGTGKNVITVNAPTLGKNLKISLTVDTADGKVLLSSITIGSGLVDMIVEPNGYVPTSFYGKLSPSYQNTIKIVAIPHLANPSGVEYNPKSLIYTWKKDDSVLEDISGYGKQSMSISGDLIPRSFVATVDIVSADGAVHGEGNVSVDQEPPSILFYVNDPLYGPMYNKAVSNTISIGSQKETSVLAVPFGFNTANKSALSLDWTVNGAEHPELADNYSIILRAPDAVSGSSQIALSIRNAVNILQGADNAFTAYFSNAKPQATTTRVTF